MNQVWHSLPIDEAISLNHSPNYQLDEVAFRATPRAQDIKGGDILIVESDLSDLPGSFPSTFQVVKVLFFRGERSIYEKECQMFFIDLTRKGHIVRRSDYLTQLS